MPAKKDRCVKDVMEQGKTEQQAWAICTAALDSNTMKYSIDDDSGFLHVYGICARDGLQEYYGYEIGLDGDDANKVFDVYRPQDEVLASLSSYNGSIVTDDHPAGGIVTTENGATLSNGSVSEANSIERDGVVYIIAKATITNQDLIDKILSGDKSELSAGYSRDIVPESGSYNGTPYQYVQRNIKVNHVAVVKEGRCGETCKLNLDNKGVKEMVKIQIDGKSVSMDEAEVAKYVTELKTQRDEAMAETEKMKESMDEVVASKEELQAMIEAKKTELEELQKQLEGMLTPEEAQAMAEESNQIASDAAELEIETTPKTCNDAKMREVIGKISKAAVNLDSLDKASLRAVYRISVDSAIEAKKAQKAGYMGIDKKGSVPRTGNLTNDLNAIAAEARKNRGAK